MEIDDLTYTYAPDSNLLLKVTDATAHAGGFHDDSPDGTLASDPSDDYAYDAMGNMVKDENKSIQTITYNHLNLPTFIDFGTRGTISYLYDATGRKVRKVVRDNVLSNNKVTDYANGFQYLDNVIQHFPTAEGYASRLNLRQENGVVALLPSTELPVDFFTYVYNYTDHLGNIRLSYAQDPDTQQLKIVEQNHYYPFGLRHTNYSGGKMQVVKEQELKRMAPTPEELLSYKYKYNGKEWQDELGLNMYDYGARNYDAAIGRWMNIDPLADQYRRWSPYNYCMDNPVIFTDPDGMYVDTAWIYQKDKKGNYVNKNLVKAFEAFAKSKEGIAFLSNFAEKGQVIAGHEYKESGKFDKNDTDLNFAQAEPGVGDAYTSSESKGKGIEITISLLPSGTKIDNMIDDIGHESFLHAESIANDFYDDKKLNLSNIDKDIVKNLKDHNVETSPYTNLFVKSQIFF
ncbi:RHS repeat-associated core domain-containing protein [Flavobacterium sp.]|uniref:RHS repeat domain-containing protein n=1 Tax=Flavobacterium sp. TaxID=239 RepID=UPI00260D6AD6|nr:RHS repeat-associated core domain-containing protein [Flavobacterium sp.]